MLSDFDGGIKELFIDLVGNKVLMMVLMYLNASAHSSDSLTDFVIMSDVAKLVGETVTEKQSKKWMIDSLE